MTRLVRAAPGPDSLYAKGLAGSAGQAPLIWFRSYSFVCEDVPNHEKNPVAGNARLDGNRLPV